MKTAAILFFGLLLVGFLTSSASALPFTYDRTIIDGQIRPTHTNGQWTSGMGVLFDLQFGNSSPGYFGSEPLTGSLSIVGGGDLNPENFWVISTESTYSGPDDFYSFLRIEGVNLWAGPGNAGFGRANIYASTATVPVPEPATMLLLGAGLVCFGVVGRKKLFNHK